MPMTLYTEKEYNKLRDEAQNYVSIARSFYQVLTCIYQNRDGKKGPGHGYPYIPNHYHDVVNTLIAVKGMIEKEKRSELYGQRFLDVGCGPGIIPCIANAIGFSGEGLELNPVWQEEGNHVFGKTIMEDGLKFKKYKNYKVIYYYCPINDRELEKELEEKIENDASVGAYILPFFKASSRIDKDKRFERQCSNVWKKIAA